MLVLLSVVKIRCLSFGGFMLKLRRQRIVAEALRKTYDIVTMPADTESYLVVNAIANDSLYLVRMAPRT